MNKFQIELQNYIQTDIECVKSEEKNPKKWVRAWQAQGQARDFRFWIIK